MCLIQSLGLIITQGTTYSTSSVYRTWHCYYMHLNCGHDCISLEKQHIQNLVVLLQLMFESFETTSDKYRIHKSCGRYFILQTHLKTSLNDFSCELLNAECSLYPGGLCPQVLLLPKEK